MGSANPLANVSLGGPRGRQPMSLAQIQQYNPNRANQVEAVWQPFYSTLTYALAGQTQLAFFQSAFSTPGQNYSLTNMLVPGAFPAPTLFLVTAVMIELDPSSSVSQSGASASRNAFNWIDQVAVANSGWLEFQIGNKIYLRDAPIGKFAPNFTFAGVGALAGTEAAGNTGDIQFARFVGRYYEVTPFMIPQTQNFSVTLNWPAVVALTGGTVPNIRCILDGFYYRQSQ